MIVLDTGVVVSILLGVALPAELAARIASAALAPDVVVFETLAVLRRLDGRGRIASARLTQAVDELAALPLLIEPAIGLRRRAWSLRRNITAADALFVALAASIGAPLATTDRRLALAAERHAGVEAIVVTG